MEFLIKASETKKDYNLIDELTSSKEKIVSVIGRDFNKSVANIVGLVALMDDPDTSDQDVKDIHRYLSIEANNLHLLVKNICG